MLVWIHCSRLARSQLKKLDLSRSRRGYWGALKSTKPPQKPSRPTQLPEPAVLRHCPAPLYAMDKLLKRVRMAERQVARRAKRFREAVEGSERNQHRRQVVQAQRNAGRQLSIAIKHRHEDWELGPLAPRRDVSRVDESGNYWGTISPEQAQLHNSHLTDEQKHARSAWAGGSQYLCLAPGDRVVILDGPYKGRITKIIAIEKETMTVSLGEDILVGAL